MAKQLSVGEIVIDKLQCEGAFGSFDLAANGPKQFILR